MQRLPPQQSQHHREQKLLHGPSRPSLPDSSPPLTDGSLLTSVLGSFSPSFSFLSSQRIPVLEKDCSQGFQRCSEVNVHTLNLIQLMFACLGSLSLHPQISSCRYWSYPEETSPPLHHIGHHLCLYLLEFVILFLLP